MKQTCILILGMHRSGTSALTGVLNLLDVYLGNTLMKANFANEKGYFENDKIFEINEILLSQCDSSWNDTFYNEAKLECIQEVDTLKSIIKKEFEYSNLFAIKDPRLALLFPIYKKVLESLSIDIKIILPYRNPLEVASSLHKRDSMSKEKGMLLWAFYFLLAEKYSRDYDRVFIDFDILMTNPQKIMTIISEKLHIDFNAKYAQHKEKISEFLEPNLKHHNIAMDNLSDSVPLIVKKIVALKENFNHEKTLIEFDALTEELFSYQKLFYNSDIVAVHDELIKTKKYLDTQEKQQKEKLYAKDEALEHVQKLLQEQSDSLQQQQEKLHVKEEALQQCNKLLQEKDEKLQQYQHHEQKHQEALQHFQQLLQEQDKSLQQYQHHEQKQQEELHVKDEALQHLQKLLQEQDDSLQKQKSQEVQQKEKLQVKDKELQHLQKLLQEYKNLKNNLNKKNLMIESLQDELVSVYTSNSWQITRFFRKLKRYFK